MAGRGRRFAARGAPVRWCNLERFLEATTPVVASNCSSKESVNCWRQSDADDPLPFFILGDLWDAFRECSAYGTAVPIVLNGCTDGIVQYYVPNLSAIQLYGRFRRHIGPSRTSARESDSDYCQDTVSEEASDLEHDTSSSTNAFPFQETSESSCSEVSSDDGESHEQLLFEFLETEPPYQREPLADKISSLAKRFPELKTLRSCDLSPTSWISVAWQYY
uniref:Uncharacterized protein n=1 Tax=Arundo donax TaxID=35708 RepID=A0A0A8Y954_ARUDO